MSYSPNSAGSDHCSIVCFDSFAETAFFCLPIIIYIAVVKYKSKMIILFQFSRLVGWLVEVKEICITVCYYEPSVNLYLYNQSNSV